MQTLIIGLQNSKQSEYLKMALDEVHRQVESGKKSGLIHGHQWALLQEGERVDLDTDLVETKTTCVEGGYVKHCRSCGMNLQTYCPPKE